MNRRYLLAIVPALFFGIENSIAQAKPEECASISEDDARLNCYDMIFQPTSQSTNAPGDWQISTETNPIDDSTTAIAVLSSTSGSSRFGKSIGLVIRCQSNQTELYIPWRSYLGSDSSMVTTRIGDKEARTRSWSLSTDSQATFFPSNDIAFIKSMFGNQRFVAQTTPYNESPITAVFNISGVAKAVEPVRKHCNW